MKLTVTHLYSLWENILNTMHSVYELICFRYLTLNLHYNIEISTHKLWNKVVVNETGCKVFLNKLIMAVSLCPDN